MKINKTIKKLSKTIILSFLLAPSLLNPIQAFADSAGGGTNS